LYAGWLVFVDDVSRTMIVRKHIAIQNCMKYELKYLHLFNKH